MIYNQKLEALMHEWFQIYSNIITGRELEYILEIHPKLNNFLNQFITEESEQGNNGDMLLRQTILFHIWIGSTFQPYEVTQFDLPEKRIETLIVNLVKKTFGIEITPPPYDENEILDNQ